MPGDKINRVKSIRKWLEKAEQSYTSHRNLSGELNLMLARAEMKRLDETHPHRKLRKWLMRAGSLAAAVMIFAGYTWVSQKDVEKPAASPPVAVEERSTVPAPVPAQTEAEHRTAPVEAEPAPAPPAQVIENPQAEAVTTESQVQTQTQPQPAAPVVEQAAPQPVLSTEEIQSVVGEAGRALRGQ